MRGLRRSAWLFAGSLGAVACNSVLGIDPATVRGVDGGDDATQKGDVAVCNPVEAGIPDFDAACGYAADGCAPGPFDGVFSAPIPHPHTASCSPKQIQDFFAACELNGAAGCPAFHTANAECYSCLLSLATDSVTGALIRFSHDNAVVDVVNVGGCVALLDPCEQPCARLVNQFAFCTFESCVASCPVNTASEGQAFFACEAQAEKCPCSDAKRKARDCVAALGANGSPAQRCGDITTFADMYATIAPIFCGM